MAPFPQVDHYMGRTIEAVEDHELGWAIVLEGGARIVITDSLAERPEEEHVLGKALMRQDLSAHGTTLNFGTDDNPMSMKLILTPNKYAISEPAYNDGQLVNPQQPVEVAHLQSEELVPAAPGERVVDGPSDEFTAEQERLATEREQREVEEAERRAQEAAAEDETDPRDEG